MALDINFDVWEQPANWKTQSATGASILYNAYNLSVPSNPIPKTWNQMIDDGKQPKNADLDFSCAPWRINADSMGLNIRGCWWKPMAGDNNTTIPSQFNLLKNREHCPFVLCYGSSSLPRYIRPYNSYMYEDSNWTGSAHVSNSQVAINFRYPHLIVTPIVRYIRAPYDMETMPASMTTVAKNLDEFDFADVAAIIDIGFKIWSRNNNTTWSAKCLSPLFNYDFQGSSLTFMMQGNIPWFAGYNGMKLFAFPYSNNNSSWGGSYNYHWLMNQGFENNYMPSFQNKTDDYCKSYHYCINKDNTTRELVPTFGGLSSSDSMKVTRVISADHNIFPCGSYFTGDAQELYNIIKRELAYLGLPFTMLESNVGVKQLGDNGYYLPVFDDNRTTTGEYKDGADALTLDNSNWDWIYDLPPLSDIDPVIPDIPDIPVNDTGNRGNKQNFFPKYTYPNSVYALTESQFLSFVSDVNGLYHGQADDTQLKIDFKGSNPNDYIIGCYGIPFNVHYTTSTATSIKIGPVTLPNATGLEVDTENSFTRSCGQIKIPALGDFRDYDPYTQVELYLPMCGSVKLDAAQVVGRTIEVIYFYDILTLSCTACVYRDDDMLIATANGDIGAHLPLSSSRMGDYQNSVKATENAINQNGARAGIGIISAAVSIGALAAAPVTGGTSLALAGAAIAGGGTAITGISNAEQLQYELEHKQPQLSVCSSPSGMVSQWIAQLKPWLFIKRAEMLSGYNSNAYGKTVGFACCKNNTVRDNTGFTVCSNINTNGIYATADEINAIKQAFTKGVIL